MRLLGPNENRLVTVTNLEPRKPGQVSPAVGQILRDWGWTIYDGPGKTRAGWVAPETDENLHPRPLKRR